MADTSQGYVVLKPAAQVTRCRWMAGYVSTEMFITWNRPLFDIMLDGRAKSADDVNRIAAHEQLNF